MNKYISTTLPYINSNPHIGHCFEFIITDFIARRERSKGNSVFFNTGVDEHGIKVQLAAENAGVSSQEWCDTYYIKWVEFCEKIQLSNDNFFRTSSSEHKEFSLKCFNQLLENGFLVKKKYKGYYCNGCESYKTEREILDGKCSIHFLKLKETEEDNYFFDLTKNPIDNTLVDTSLNPELEKNFNELKEISITRKNIDWAIKVDSENSIYVWAEALLNYYESVFTKVKDYQSYWDNSLIICGKDNIKFQSYILPALLKALGITQNKNVLVHGTILDDAGIKMSKTLENVIDPIDVIDRYGISPLRFYFSTFNFFRDSKFNEIELINLWNSLIVNQFGNTISRLFHIGTIKNVSYSEEYIYYDKHKHIFLVIDELIDSYDYSNALNKAFELIGYLSKRINDERPYDKNSTNAEEIITEGYVILKYISNILSSIIPEYSQVLKEAFIKKEKIIIFNKL
jgi:methionyl-tRNA synthetase